MLKVLLLASAALVLAPPLADSAAAAQLDSRFASVHTLPAPSTASGPAVALQGTVTGQVLDANTGAPIQGAQVYIPTLDTGVLTGGNGRFILLNVPTGTHTIEVRRVGYQVATQTVTVRENETSAVDFRLTEEAIMLNEIVATVSASEQRRVEIGTDAELVDVAGSIHQAAVATFSELAMARAPSVTIQDVSGQTGAGQPIRVRGATSLTQSNVPIVYLNGIRVSNETYAGPKSFDFGFIDSQSISRMNDFNPLDLQSFQVEKGPSAAAVYGSEAGAGVLVLDSRRGQVGGHTMTLSAETSASWDRTDWPDSYLNATRVAGITSLDAAGIDQWERWQNPVTNDIYLLHNPLTDPRTTPLGTGVSQDYHFSASGGAEGVGTYYTSVRYMDQDGILPGNSAKRFNLTGRLIGEISESFTVDFTGMYINSDIKVPHNDHSAFGIITNGWLGQPLTSFGKRPDGSRGDCMATLLLGQNEDICRRLEGNLVSNFETLATLDNGERLGRVVTGMTATWTPTGWLTTRLTGGIDQIQTRTWQFVPVDDARPFGDRSAGFLTEHSDNDVTYSVNWVATAEASLTDDLAVSSTAGVQYAENEFRLTGCEASGFANNTAIACDAAVSFSSFQDLVANVELGGFYQQHVNFRDYAFLTGSIRLDDNSAFGSQQDAIWSPSFNASLLVSDMPFWGVDRDVVNSLRLRAAWGRAAQAPAPYVHARTFRPVRIAEGGTQVSGITPSQPGNPNLTAERGEELEMGVDFALFDARVDGKFTYYRQSITDAIIATQVPPSLGFESAQFVNVGEVSNKGFEASLTGEILRGRNVRWQSTVSVFTQDPIVEDLGGLPPTFSLREGYSPSMVAERVVGSAIRNPDGTIASFELLPGDIEGTDRRYLGRTEPTNQQSLGTTLTFFDNLQVHALFHRAAGHINKDQGADFNNPLAPGFIVGPSWARRHTLTPAEQAALERGSSEQNAFFWDDADYIKLREITLGYQLPASITALFGPVAAARLTVGARNLKTWSDFKGPDPELSKGGGRDDFAAVGYYNLPPPLRAFMRVHLTF